MSSGFNVIRRHSLDATGVRIKELSQQLATARSKLEGSQLETDDVRSQGRMDHSTIKLNDERLSFGTTLYASDSDYYYAFPQEPDLKYLKVWFMLDHLGARLRDISGFKNDAYISGHPTLRRAYLDLGFQQLPSSPATPVMLFNSGTDSVSQMDGEYVWVPDNETIQFSKYSNGFSIHFRFCCLNFEPHLTSEGGSYARRFAAKTDNSSNGWSVIVYSTGANTGGVEFEIMHNGITYAKKTYGYSAGMWYQIVVTYDPNAGPTQTERIKIYTGGNENSIDSTFGTILSTTYNLRIGARTSGSGFFHGYIHDFRLWFDKVLTQNEVTNINRNELTIEDIDKGHVFIVQYALVQGVLKSKFHVWDVVGRTLKIRSHRYNIVTAIPTITKRHKWNLIRKIALLKTHVYTILELVQRLLTIVYDQAGGLVVTKTHRWNIQSSISQVTRTHTHKWNVTAAEGGAASSSQYVRFTKNTTAGSNITQEVTFTGTPQAIIVWSDATTTNNTFTDAYYLFYGFSDGTNHACISSFAKDNVTTTDTFGGFKYDKVIAFTSTSGTVSSEATVAFSTNKATFTWTTNDTTAPYIHCLALWGMNSVEVKSFAMGTTATGNRLYSLTNASMTPTFIHTITESSPSPWSTAYGSAVGIGAATATNQFAIINNSVDTAASSNAGCQAFTNRCLVGFDDDTGAQEEAASFSSFGTGSFIINWVDAPIATSRYFAVLAIDSPNIGIGSFAQPASTGTQNVNTPANVDAVKGLMVFSNQQTGTTLQSVAALTIGGATGTGATEQGLIVVRENDAVSPTVSSRLNKTGSIVKSTTATATASSSTTTSEAAVSTLGTVADQFTLNWTTADATARVSYYVAFGGSGATEVSTSKTHIYDMEGRVYPPASKIHKYNVESTGGGTLVYDVADNDSSINMGAGLNTRAGTKIVTTSHPLYNIVPHTVKAYVNIPSFSSGDVSCKIYDTNGATVLRTLGTIDITTLAADQKVEITFEDPDNTVALLTNRYIVIQYENVTGMYLYYNNTNVLANTNLQIYYGIWYNYSGFDWAAQVYD